MASPQGSVTSGAPSPTLGVPIAMAYLDPGRRTAGRGGASDGRLAVDIRGSAEPARLTRPAVLPPATLTLPTANNSQESDHDHSR
jgi:glycine cleavage system aminomethyltransferase T